MTQTGEQGAEETENKGEKVEKDQLDLNFIMLCLFYFFFAESSLRPVASDLFCANVSIKQVELLTPCNHRAITLEPLKVSHCWMVVLAGVDSG